MDQNSNRSTPQPDYDAWKHAVTVTNIELRCAVCLDRPATVAYPVEDFIDKDGKRRFLISFDICEVCNGMFSHAWSPPLAFFILGMVHVMKHSCTPFVSDAADSYMRMHNRCNGKLN